MKLKDYLLKILFPLKCPLCGEIIPLVSESCSCCGEESFVLSPEACRHCAAEKENCTCSEKGEIYLENVAGVYIYSGKIKSQIALFKFGKQKNFAKEFSLRMSERVARVFSDADFDFVTFVPASEKAEKERGFNQSELLAKGVAEKLFVPKEDVLLKIKETDSQHKLSAKDRIKNLDGAFAVRDKAVVKDKVILICDDIKTTGTTLRRCSDTLYENGAKEVYCLVLAITDYLTDF